MGLPGTPLSQVSPGSHPGILFGSSYRHEADNGSLPIERLLQCPRMVSVDFFQASRMRRATVQLHFADGFSSFAGSSGNRSFTAITIRPACWKVREMCAPATFGQRRKNRDVVLHGRPQCPGKKAPQGTVGGSVAESTAQKFVCAVSDEEERLGMWRQRRLAARIRRVTDRRG